MSVRAVAVLAVCALAACDGDVAPGPERERAEVFAYVAPMQAGQTLALRNMSGALQIEPATDDTLRVVADLTWRGDSTLPKDVTFRAEPMAGGTLVCAVFGEGRCTVDDYDGKSDGSGFSIGRGRMNLGLGGSSPANVRFRVQVPAGVKLDLVMVDGDVTSASSAPVQVRGVNGEIAVVTSVGPVSAKSVNGSIDARMTTLAGSDSVLIELVNGDAYAFIPETAAATLDVGVVNGTVLSDFPGVAGGDRLNKTITGVIGAGTTPVRVRTMNGNAQLRRLDAEGRAYPIDPPPGG